jgi:GDPmannose 4,6-dehydratase
VIATGQSHSVREFVETTFGLLDLDWQKYVEYDEYLLRPAEVDYLCGDASKARRELGWSPRVSFAALVRMMVESDLELARREAASR